MAESVSFDPVADMYDETRGGLARGRRFAGEIAAHLVSGPVLEAGVGTGVVSLGLRELGWRVAGVDLSPAMLAKARERLGSSVVIGDATALPVASGALANVVFVHVLHLVADMRAAVAEAARALRTGGRVVALHDVPATEPGELSAVIAPLRRLRPPRADTTAAVVAAGAEVGLRLVAAARTTPVVTVETPKTLAEQCERRVFSWMWPIDEADWQRTAEPVIAALRAMPDPDRPRRQVRSTRITALERSG